MKSEEANKILKTLEFDKQIILIVSGLAGRDFLITPWPHKLFTAIEEFRDGVLEIIEEKLSFIRGFLFAAGVRKGIYKRCQLEIDDYNRIFVYFDGEKIGTLKFGYKEKELDKQELERFFRLTKGCGMDICVEVSIPGQEGSEFIINKNVNIENKLKYYLENYDDELKLKKNKDIKIVDVLPVNFVFGQTFEHEKK